MSFKEQIKEIEKQNIISKTINRIDRWWGKTKEIVCLVREILRVIVR